MQPWETSILQADPVSQGTASTKLYFAYSPLQPSSTSVPFYILSSSPSSGDQAAREPYYTATSTPSPLTRLLTTPRRSR